MNCYVWKYVDELTTAWHNGGGCLVIAEDLESARVLAEQSTTPKCEALTKSPDHVWAVKDAEPICLIFPDAGCC